MFPSKLQLQLYATGNSIVPKRLFFLSFCLFLSNGLCRQCVCLYCGLRVCLQIKLNFQLLVQAGNARNLTDSKCDQRPRQKTHFVPTFAKKLTMENFTSWRCWCFTNICLASLDAPTVDKLNLEDDAASTSDEELLTDAVNVTERNIPSPMSDDLELVVGCSLVSLLICVTNCCSQSHFIVVVLIFVSLLGLYVRKR